MGRGRVARIECATITERGSHDDPRSRGAGRRPSRAARTAPEAAGGPPPRAPGTSGCSATRWTRSARRSRHSRPARSCRVIGDRDHFLGYAYVNPHALICARILGRDERYPPGKSLLVHRLQVALALRERLYADAVLPPRARRVRRPAGPGARPLRRRGGRADRHRRHGGAQGRDRRRARAGDRAARGGVEERLAARASSRACRPTSRPRSARRPSTSRSRRTACASACRWATGQKTGWFYDQAANRAAFLKYVQRRARAGRVQLPRRLGPRGGAGRRGGGDLRRLVRAGARAAAGNGRGQRPRGRTRAAAMPSTCWRRCARPASASTWWSSIRRRSSSAAATSRKGQAAYRKLNQLAMQLLPRDGILVSLLLLAPPRAGRPDRRRSSRRRATSGASRRSSRWAATRRTTRSTRRSRRRAT